MKDVILTPEKKQAYDVLTDSTIPCTVRGHIAYEGFTSRVNDLKKLGELNNFKERD